ncbi:hypothetical protein [Paenibacillus cremeus]
MEGSLRLNKVELHNKRDSARITSTSSLRFFAVDHTRFMLVNLP